MNGVSSVRNSRFQSTCLREARPCPGVLTAWAQISIHVPTRGTTTMMVPFTVIFSISIHVPTRGTTLNLDWMKARGTFQSTCLREARLPSFIDLRTVADFNPRAYARHDCYGVDDQDLLRISIHVPTRGTTLYYISENRYLTCPNTALLPSYPIKSINSTEQNTLTLKLHITPPAACVTL